MQLAHARAAWQPSDRAEPCRDDQVTARVRVRTGDNFLHGVGVYRGRDEANSGGREHLKEPAWLPFEVGYPNAVACSLRTISDGSEPSCSIDVEASSWT